MKHSANFLVVAALLLGHIIWARPCYAGDPLPITGKGMYLWQLWSSHGGGRNLDAIIARLQSAGVGWIVIKMADGNSNYNSPDHSLYNWAVANYGSMDSVVSVFHSNGIKLLAFQYVYGIPRRWSYSITETDAANMILDVKGIDGLLIDAEIQYDTLSNRDAAAQAYCDSIRAHHPEGFVGLTAWARIVGHATFPWVAFLSRVEVNMPQTYWAARPTTPQNELSIMSTQFTTYTNIWISQGDSAADKPIMPIGQGEYFGYSNDVMPGDITSFCDLSQAQYIYPGVSLWEYNQIAHAYVWDEYAAAWQTTSVSGSGNSPMEYSLSQNYPNPFNPVTTIQFSIPVGTYGRTSLRVYDLLGREVAVLVNEKKAPGSYQVTFDGAGLASGVYIYELRAGEFVQTRKMALVR
jgi:hypothetical protein